MRIELMLSRGFLLALILSVLCSMPAVAQWPEANRPTVLVLGAGMGYVDMKEVNDEIEFYTRDIPIIEGSKQIHLDLNFRMDLLIPVSDNLLIGPRLQFLVAPKIIKIIQIPSGVSGDYTIIAVAVVPAALVHLIAPLSESTELDLSAGPAIYMTSVTFDRKDFGDGEITASGTGIGFEGGIAFNFLLGGQNSTSLIVGVNGRYALIKASVDASEGGGEIEIDFTGVGVSVAIGIPL